jgi:ribosomal protein L9
LVAESREIQQQLAELGDRYLSIEQGGVGIIEHGLRLLGATGGIVARLCENRTELELVGAVGLPADAVDAHRRFALTAQLPMAEAVRDERPVWAESPDEMTARYPQFASVLHRLGVQALAAVPVRHMGRVQGAFCLEFDKPRRLAPYERTQLLTLGGHFARALYHSRLYFAEREAREEAERARAAAEAAERAEETASLLRKTVLTIAHQAGDDGRLFGSVTGQEIVDAVKQARGLKLDKRRVKLDEPLKTTGTHMVTVEVAEGVTAEIKTIVTPEA